MTERERTPLDEPPRTARQCPRCGGLFEAAIEVAGKLIPGHQVGDPSTCIPPSGTVLERDARRRRPSRRGQ